MKILSIDGGGIKGVFAASFLAELERTLEIQIWKYFDMLAGTSTGGIIAAALAVGIPAEEILELYMNKAKDIFPETKKSTTMLFKPKYESKALKNALEETFGDQKIKDCKTRLLIPAYNLVNQSIRVFKTPHAQDLFTDKNIKLVECLLSTTAAPTFFSPYRMKGGRYIDGGVGANNPTLIAVIEGITRCGWKREEISVLSIGGIDEIRNLTTGKENMTIKDIQKIIKCYMNAENQYADNISNLLLGKDRNRILRVNHQDKSGEITLDRVDLAKLTMLKDWGVNELQNHIYRIKQEFLNEEKSDVQFYNCKR